MLSIPYGSVQCGVLKSLKLEVCFPAQGFKPHRNEASRIATPFGAIPAQRLFTTAARVRSRRRTGSRPIPDSLCYQSKGGMRKVDVRRLEEKLDVTLITRGYELSSHPRISGPGLMRKYPYLQSRVNAFLFRLGQ